ncbi:MAG: pyruvate kinase [Phycisphaerales bacterium]|nr:pyruvate kinase [Planctomycetota bacterium]MCH8507587.1 pyruvate kinase [Phycisphaerales bacterium]
MIRSHTQAPVWLTKDPTRPPHAKIVATLGPASDSPEMLAKLVDIGVNVFRLNFSHGDFAAMDQRLARVRAVLDQTERAVALLGDLQGPKMRVGRVPDIDPEGGIVVRPGDDVMFRDGQGEAVIENGVPVFGATFDRLFHDVDPGQRVLINDGAIRMLAVDRADGSWLRCRVTIGGRITSAKGVNLPESDLAMPAITEKDWACVEWAVRNRLDYLALSFVRNAAEVIELRERLEAMCADGHCADKPGVPPRIPIVAKIEKPQALINLDEIIDASDAIMVARGDLGVEMDVARVPVAQKYILATCADKAKPCIVATQMLETMIDNASPTRAEASDVANAVFDGADAVMLSGETAVGRHPDLVVDTMRRIIQVTEARIDELAPVTGVPKRPDEYPYRSAALAHGAWHIANELDAKCVVVWSQIGGMARYLSQHNFRVPIYAYTSSRVAARRMALFGGVTPICIEPPGYARLRDWTDEVEARLIADGLATDGDPVVMIAGKPLGEVQAQSTLAILRIGDPASGFRAPDPAD